MMICSLFKNLNPKEKVSDYKNVEDGVWIEDESLGLYGCSIDLGDGSG